MPRKMGPSRSFNEEVNRQRGRLGLVADEEDAAAIFNDSERHVWARSSVVQLRSCNAGRDIKLPLEAPRILNGFLPAAAWCEFAEECNESLKKYRAGGIDWALVATLPFAPPIFGVIVARERKLKRKKCAVLSASAAKFNLRFANKIPKLELHFSFTRAEKDLSRSLEIRIGTEVQSVVMDSTFSHDCESKPRNEVVSALLRRCGLSEDYANRLFSEGFDSPESLRVATFEDLIACGMKRGHARKLLESLKASTGKEEDAEAIENEDSSENSEIPSSKESNRHGESNPFDSPIFA